MFSANVLFYKKTFKMESKFNNVNTTLDIGETWTGEAEVCNGFIIILIDIKSSEPCSIIVRQSDNESNYNFEKTIEYLEKQRELEFKFES